MSRKRVIYVVSSEETKRERHGPEKKETTQRLQSILVRKKRVNDGLEVGSNVSFFFPTSAGV